MSVSIIGIQGIPDIQKGDDLAQIIVDRVKRQKETIKDHDILVISQKVVSKAEGQTKVRPRSPPLIRIA